MRAWTTIGVAAALVATAAGTWALGRPERALAAGTCTVPTVDHTGQSDVTVTGSGSIITPPTKYTDCDLSISTGTTLHFAFAGVHTLTSDSGDAQSFNLDSNGATFRFDHAGTYNFHCFYHVSYGMVGVLHVVGANVNSAPTASFTGPTTAAVGHEVSFDGSASKDADAGDTLTYHWDLDGSAANGFERTTTTPTVKTTYASAGHRTVRLQVSDNHGASSHVAARTIDVTAAPAGGAYPGVSLLHSTIVVPTSRNVALRLRCPAGTKGGCTGRAHIVKPAGPAKAFKIAAGRSRTVRLHLSKALYKRLVKQGRLTATLALSGHDGAGHRSHQPRKKLKLKLPPSTLVY